ncbi:glycosyltransferase family 2 protein [Prevotella sp. RM4]|uniref:glycosyltransferase family 2 protein n=1 Tax=Prevotella sp. RM4 TaxID=1200547 RepID=UPI00068B8009|nr:glycosyltransferase family 2 protein [Prevotella sp. RM4]
MVPKVSIIMPVYNAEKYLHRAVDSILAQTMREWELICVDDGSTDDSPSILDEYAKSDSRIHVIHKENGGVSMARQTGVDMANGEYSIHFDSDDWADPSMLVDLYDKAKVEDADMVICNYYHNYSDGREILMQQHPTRLNTPDQIDDIFFGGIFSGLPMKLIRHSIYENYNIRFFPGVNYCEDVLICIQIMKYQNLKLSFFDNAYYHYWMNNESITHNVTRKTFDALTTFKNIIYELLPEETYSRIRNQVALSQFVQCYPQADIMSQKEIDQYCIQLLPYVWEQPGLRYKIGFIFLRCHLYGLARKFIKF